MNEQKDNVQFSSKIIGISGKIGSGKDTFAERFAILSETPCQRHAFADKVKENLQLLTDYPMTLIYAKGEPFTNEIYNYTQVDKNVLLPLWNKAVGESLQIIGTDALRDRFDSDVWVKSLFSTVGKKILEMGHILLIPDVRFKNEANYILENGGIIVRLEGDPADIKKNSKRDMNHKSETELDDFQDFTFTFKSVNMELLDLNIKKVLNFINK